MGVDSLNSVERPDALKVVQDILKRIRVVESKILQLLTNRQPVVYDALTTGSTDMQFDVNSTVKVTPNADATYTTAVPPAGYHVTLIILTSGTTSRTITFGSGFKSTGTLATGTADAKVFVLQFVSDGTNLYEESRTVAMSA